MARSILDSKRITKEEADYREPSERESDATEKREDDGDCDDCTMFRKPDRCTLVIGKISPEGVCKYFERKK